MAIPLKYNVRNLLVRKLTTLATAGGIALVVLVSLLLLSLVMGLTRMLVITGSSDTLVAVRKGSTSESVSLIQRDQVLAVQHLPGIARTSEGQSLVSPELISQPLFTVKEGGQENLIVRGVTPIGFVFHKNLHFVAGRPPRQSLGEVAVGLAVSQRYQGAQLGETLQFGQRSWKVVGIFSTDGSAFDSEVWVDIDDLFTDANRANYSSIRLSVVPGTDREALIRRIDEDPRISLEAKPEIEYYSEQAEGVATLYLLTLVLSIIMGTGAVFGAMNMMFAAVAQRTAKIGTLRALGFSRGAVLVSFVMESVLLAVLGYIGGVLLGLSAIALINSMMQGVAFQLPSFSTAVVSLHVSPIILLLAFGLAVLMGILGGFFPARHAARLGVTEALRSA